DDPSIQAFLLAALTAGGGITGFARTGSIPSIAAGVTVGALVITTPLSLPSHPHTPHHPLISPARPQYGLGGLRVRNRQPYGLELALAASVLLAGSSFPRALKTMKPLPIGLSVVAAFGLYRFGMLWRAQV
ncbi:MAG: hypothetical protein Q9210_006389, partial [Variospora velana]